MKHVLSFLFMVTIFSASQAQFEWGMKAGISSYQLGENSLTEWFDGESFNQQITNAEYGHHFGLYTRVQLGVVFIEPAVMFQSSSFSYQLENYSESGIINVVKNDRYNQVNVPLLVGMKAGFFRVQAGPVGNFLISKTSDLWDADHYREQYDSFTYGYQLGAGVDIWRFRLDVLYENSLKGFGNQINIGGHSFLIDQNPPRLIFTLGYSF